MEDRYRGRRATLLISAEAGGARTIIQWAPAPWDLAMTTPGEVQCSYTQFDMSETTSRPSGVRAHAYSMNFASLAYQAVAASRVTVMINAYCG